MPINDLYSDRQKIINALFIVAALVLTLKAAHLQLFDSSYKDRANAITIDKQIIYPSRGLIYDRNNKLLVNNEPMYDLMVTPYRINPAMDTLELCRLIGITKEEFITSFETLKKEKYYSKVATQPLIKKIEPEVFAKFQEHLFDYPGFSIQLRNARIYPYSCAAQPLGYISEVSSELLEKHKGLYLPGDYLGSGGIEKSYELILRGQRGVKYVLKDNMGRKVGPYKEGALDSATVSGKDLITSIDIDLQAYGEELMRNKNGSIVAIEPESGEILAMITSPTYDPNILSIKQNRGDAFSLLLNDKNKPFFDRSVMSKYPPGSIFKTVVGLIALDENVTTANRGIYCPRGYRFRHFFYKCHGHPYASNIAEAISHSCNAYFYTLFRDIIDKYGFKKPKLGLDLFNSHLYEWGLGQKLEIDFPNEKAGNVPTPRFYDKLYPRKKGGWKSPTIMSNGIGQGEVQLSTIQMANLTAIIANRGTYYTPHIVKAYKDGTPIDKKYTTKHKVRIDSKHFEPIINGMEGVMRGGTGKTGYISDIAICGKTGTVQNPRGEDHSVLIAFAPKYNPKIAVAVYVENGGWGYDYAAPIASLIIEKYINREVRPFLRWRESKMKNSVIFPQRDYLSPWTIEHRKEEANKAVSIN